MGQSQEWLTSNPERKRAVCVECGKIHAIPKPDITEVVHFKPFLSTEEELEEQVKALKEIIKLLQRVTKTKSLPQGGGIEIVQLNSRSD